VGAGIILDVLVVEYKMASLYLSGMLFSKHLIWGDPVKGQAVECCSYWAARHCTRQWGR